MLEAAIETFHPVRWALTVAIGVPALLGFLFLASKFRGEDADRWLRLLRGVVLAEFIALIVLCVFGYFYEQRAQARDAKLYPPPGRLVDIGGYDIGGYRLHLNCIGQGGPTVILEYGLEGSAFDWYRVQPEIARIARVCTYDRAGYGWSDASPRPRVPSVMAEELHRLLLNAGEKPPYIFVGHSYGSLIGQMFAHRFPAETSGLVLVDGMNLGPAPGFSLEHRLWLRFLQWTATFGLPRWRRWYAAATPELQGLAEVANCRSRTFAAYYGEWSQLPQSAAEMRAITNLATMPLIVIARDPALGRNADEESRHAQQQQDLLKLSSNSRLLVATGSGHDIPGARPDVVIEAVKRLLRPQAPAGSPETP